MTNIPFAPEEVAHWLPDPATGAPRCSNSVDADARVGLESPDDLARDARFAIGAQRPQAPERAPGTDAVHGAGAQEVRERDEEAGLVRGPAGHRDRRRPQKRRRHFTNTRRVFDLFFSTFLDIFQILKKSNTKMLNTDLR